jgi:hypothetical protein
LVSASVVKEIAAGAVPFLAEGLAGALAYEVPYLLSVDRSRPIDVV